MAEDRDDLTPAADAPDAAAYTARSKDPDAIEQDIRETRSEMSETLDAIGARFRPDYIKEQAKDALRSTARDAGTTMLDTIKENPIPSLIAGLSIGWLIAKGGSSSSDGDGGYDRDRDFDEGYRRRYGRYPDYGSFRASAEPYGAGRREGGYADQGGDGGHSLKEKAGDAADQARQKAGDLADQAGEQLHDLRDDAARYGRRATNWLEHQMDANPLAVGAVALAAGALVGLAVPGTEQEDALMGRASEQLTEKAKAVAGEKLDQVKSVAKEVADEAKDKAGEVVDAAKDKAQDQGLTGSGSGMSDSGTSTGSSFSGSGSSGSSMTDGGTKPAGAQSGAGAETGNKTGNM